MRAVLCGDFAFVCEFEQLGMGPMPSCGCWCPCADVFVCVLGCRTVLGMDTHHKDLKQVSVDEDGTIHADNIVCSVCQSIENDDLPDNDVLLCDRKVRRCPAVWALAFLLLLAVHLGC